MIFDLVNDFAAALDAMPNTHPRQGILKRLDEAVRRDIHFINQRPTTLFQCLWNTCWWYDCPEAAKHYDPPLDGWPSDGPQWARLGPKLYRLLEDWRITKEQQTVGFVWVRSLLPPPNPLGSVLQATFSIRNRDSPEAEAPRVVGIACSPDGLYVAACFFQADLRVWNTDSGIEVARLSERSGVFPVQGIVAWSPDGTRLAVASENLGVRIWDPFSGSLLHQFPVPRGAKCLAYSADGKRLVVGTGGGAIGPNILVFDLASGTEVARYGEERWPLKTLALSPDGKRIVAAYEGWLTMVGRLVILDVATGKELFHLTDHKSDVHGLVFLGQSQHFAAVAGGTIRIWDSQTGTEKACLEMPRKGSASRVACSADGRKTVAVAGDGTIYIWDEGNLSASFQSHTSDVTGIAFCGQSGRFITAAKDGTARLWDMNAPQGPQPRGHAKPITSLLFCLEGTLLASASLDKTVWVWDLVSGRAGVRLEHDSTVTRLATAQGKDRLVAVTWDGLRVWKLPEATLIAAMENPGNKTNTIRCVCLSCNGNRIVTGHQDRTVAIWDIRRRAVIARCYGHQNYPSDVAISRNGRLALSGDWNGAVCLWNTHTGQLLARHVSRGGTVVRCVAFTPDGRIALADVGGGIQAWRASGWYYALLGWYARLSDRTASPYDWPVHLREVVRLQGQFVEDMTFSADGKWLASSGREVQGGPSLRVWHVPTGHCRELIEGRADGRAAPDRHYRAIMRFGGLEFRPAGAKWATAWLPIAFDQIATHPSESTWAGADANHLYLFTLEGGQTASS